MKNVLTFLSVVFSLTCNAQDENSLHLGAYSPFFVQPGISVNLEVPIGKQEEQFARHALQPGVAIFHQFNVGSNYSARMDYNYTLHSGKKGWDYKVGAGIGYLLSSQRNDGTVNLATGDLTHNSEITSLFQPLAHIILKKKGEKKRGWYIKALAGPSFSLSSASLFTAIEVGIHWKLNTSH